MKQDVAYFIRVLIDLLKEAMSIFRESRKPKELLCHNYLEKETALSRARIFQSLIQLALYQIVFIN